MSQAALGAKVRSAKTDEPVTGSAVSQWENGETAPRSEYQDSLAAALECDVAWLMHGIGKDPADGVEVVGEIRMGGSAKHYARGNVRSVPAPPGCNHAKLVAWDVKDDSNSPVYRPGDIVFIERDARDPADLVGSDCLVDLPNGASLLRRLMAGSAPDLYTLEAYRAGSISDSPVTAARRVAGLWRG